MAKEAPHGILEEEIKRVQDFYAKQATRDAMKTRIHDYLYDENRGLPESFEPEEIAVKAEAVLAHLVAQHSDVWSILILRICIPAL